MKLVNQSDQLFPQRDTALHLSGPDAHLHENSDSKRYSGTGDLPHLIYTCVV